MQRNGQMFLKLLSLLTLFALRECASDCNSDRDSAGALSVHCCHLTRPSIEPSYNDCNTRMLETFTKTTNFTKTEEMALRICNEECVFIDNGYIDAEPPFLLDMKHLEQNLQQIMPEPKETAIDFMKEAYSKCAGFRQAHPKKIDIQFPDLSSSITENLCSPYAMQITVCVRIFAMQSCPEEFQVKSAECVKAKAYFDNCLLGLKKLQIAPRT